MMKLKAAMKDQYSSYPAVFQYEPFPPGNCPKQLLRAAGYIDKTYRLDLSAEFFQETRGAYETALEVARSARGLGVHWCMKANETPKRVQPYGLAIVSSNQVNLPGMKDHVFAQTSE